MASQNQNIVDKGSKAVSTQKTYGTRRQANLNSMFGDSPIYQNDITNEERVTTYQHLLDNDVTETFNTITSIQIPGGPGLGINSFNTSFTMNDIPDVAANNETSDGKEFGKGEGAPTTPYIPPLTSPGVGSVEASDQPPFDVVNGSLPELGNEYGSGYGATANPYTTAAEIEKQTMIGTYISGRSFTNSESTG